MKHAIVGKTTLMAAICDVLAHRGLPTSDGTTLDEMFVDDDVIRIGDELVRAGGVSRRKQRRQHVHQPEGVTVTVLPHTAPGPRAYEKDPVTGMKRGRT